MASVPPSPKHKALFIASLTWVLGIFFGMWIQHRAECTKGFFLSDTLHPRDAYAEQVKHLVQLLRFHYIDSLRTEGLYQSAVDGIFQRLEDPHIVYFSHDPTRVLTLFMDALGIRGEWGDRGWVVHTVYAGSDAAGAGIQQGDTIKSVNGRSLKEGENWIFAAGDTAYFVEVSRRDERRHIWVHTKGLGFGLAVKKDHAARGRSVRMFRMLADSVGVIALRNLHEGAYASCMRAWDSLDRRGMRYLVLDLRGNVGGDVQTLVRLANQFVETRRMPLFGVQGRDGRLRVFYSTGKPFFTLKGLIVLVDEGTSYEAEMLASILHHQVSPCLVIGAAARDTRVVRRGFALPNGDSLLMPIARYVLPFERASAPRVDSSSVEQKLSFYPTYATDAMPQHLLRLQGHFFDWWRKQAGRRVDGDSVLRRSGRHQLMRAWHNYLASSPEWYYRYRLTRRTMDSLTIDSVLYVQIGSNRLSRGNGDLLDRIVTHWQRVYGGLLKTDGD